MKTTMEGFVNAHAVRLRRQLNRQVRRSIKNHDEEAIHDLRVSIRHLILFLSEFRRFLPESKARKRLKRLNKMMDRAAEIRNRDIAITMVGAVDPELAAVLRRERAQAERRLVRSLDQWKRHD
jgi:CHAD domain-containing protein